MLITLWLLVTGLIERMLKVALLALTKFGYRSWSIFNSFVLGTDRMLWLLLSCGVVYVCLLLLNMNSATDWAWHDWTGRDRKRSDGTGNDRTGQDMTGQDATGPDSTGHKGNGTGQNGTGQGRTGRGCSWWFDFNSSVGSSIFVYVCKVVLFVGDRSKRKVRTISHKDSKDGSHSHSWNDEDHAFNHQLYQWGVDKLFHNSDEAIIRDLKLYIEDWEMWISRTRANYHVLRFLQNMLVWIYTMNIWRKDLSLTTNNYNLIKIQDGL